MRIDADELRRHIRSKTGRVKCHICRRGPLYFTDSLYRVEECFEIPGSGKSPAALLVRFTCDNCGGASFLDVMASGIGFIDDELPTHKIEYLK